MEGALPVHQRARPEAWEEPPLVLVHELGDHGRAERGGVCPSAPPLARRAHTYTEQDTAEFVQWMQSIPVAERKSTLSFPVQDLERLVWVSPIWEVLLNKLPDIGLPKAEMVTKLATMIASKGTHGVRCRNARMLSSLPSLSLLLALSPSLVKFALFCFSDPELMLPI